MFRNLFNLPALIKVERMEEAIRILRRTAPDESVLMAVANLMERVIQSGEPIETLLTDVAKREAVTQRDVHHKLFNATNKLRRAGYVQSSQGAWVKPETAKVGWLGRDMVKVLEVFESTAGVAHYVIEYNALPGKPVLATRDQLFMEET